ncbi:sigma-70 family RNA polymerase sigma factor [Rothia sp. LK2588]|uniref:sigma-70 family RNA polymerase sigma factor n=1 Tax=Rothia sp. LK2588 TaxID=3114369 RepID=UPI0034CFE561
MHTQHTLAGSERTDEALLLAVREGNLEAFGELYERYLGMARAIAYKHTSQSSRVDDIVSEAFARILHALKNGKGPHSYMGGYLATTIAHLAGEFGMLATREVPSEQEHLESMGSLDDTVLKLHDSDDVISAFTSLPERWQTVLWLTEVEAKKPREVAAAMDLSSNAVSALAIRAKESLKEGFLRAHQNAPATKDCNRFHAHISPYVRGSLSQKRSDALRSHMESCNYCTSEYLSLVGINKSMRSWIFPVLAGLTIWGTDGAAILSPASIAAAGSSGGAGAMEATNKLSSTSSSSSSSATGSHSLLGLSNGGQLLAGAAALTAATVAVAGGAVLSHPTQGSATKITAEGHTITIPGPNGMSAGSDSQKAEVLGAQFSEKALTTSDSNSPARGQSNSAGAPGSALAQAVASTGSTTDSSDDHTTGVLADAEHSDSAPSDRESSVSEKTAQPVASADNSAGKPTDTRADRPQSEQQVAGSAQPQGEKPAGSASVPGATAPVAPADSAAVESPAPVRDQSQPRTDRLQRQAKVVNSEATAPSAVDEGVEKVPGVPRVDPVAPQPGPTQLFSAPRELVESEPQNTQGVAPNNSGVQAPSTPPEKPVDGQSNPPSGNPHDTGLRDAPEQPQPAPMPSSAQPTPYSHHLPRLRNTQRRCLQFQKIRHPHLRNLSPQM